jgi:hypothetical protein
MAALPPGRYTVKVELEGFTRLTVVDINLLSAEVRDLGKMVMTVESQSEAITVTAEVTPVSTSSRRRSTPTTPARRTRCA